MDWNFNVIGFEIELIIFNKAWVWYFNDGALFENYSIFLYLYFAGGT